MRWLWLYIHDKTLSVQLRQGCTGMLVPAVTITTSPRRVFDQTWMVLKIPAKPASQHENRSCWFGKNFFDLEIIALFLDLTILTQQMRNACLIYRKMYKYRILYIFSFSTSQRAPLDCVVDYFNMLQVTLMWSCARVVAQKSHGHVPMPKLSELTILLRVCGFLVGADVL